MKRASYKKAIEWIAFNDEPSILHPEVLAGLISCCLIADIFGISPDKVANDVLKSRGFETNLPNGGNGNGL